MRRFRKVVLVLAVALTACAATRLLPTLRIAELRLEDVRLVLAAAPAPETGLVLLALDEATLAALPQRSPIDRAFLADLVRRLADAGAATIALDLLFDQATDPRVDQAFRETLIEHGAIVGWAPLGLPLSSAQSEFLNTFVDGIEYGHVLVRRDEDGVVRGVLPAQDGPAGAVPSLSSVMAARASLGSQGHATNLAMLPGTAPVFSASALATLPPAWFTGKTVLIGVDVPYVDRVLTPARSLTGTDTAGLHIHATLFQQTATGREREDAGIALTAVLSMFAAGAGLAIAATSSSVVIQLLLGSIGLLFVTALAVAAYSLAGWMLPIVSTGLSALLAQFLAVASARREQQRRREQITAAFGCYLPPPIVARFVSQPETLWAPGQQRTVSLLFTDVAGFTGFTESAAPAHVVAVLSEYLDQAARCVMECGGTVDKFIGDAVMAVFGGPVECDDHARRAIQCAMRIVQTGEAFAAQHLGFGYTRVGVHTGPAVLGNIGGEAKLDYTVLGDVVNTAARLESANKIFGTRCLISEVAAKTAGMHDELRRVAVLRPRGKHHPIGVFTAQGDPGQKEQWDKTFEMVRMCSPKALRAIDEFLTAWPEDALAIYYRRRLIDGVSGVLIEGDGS
jgi:class 3 adenylate cyclase/CHASE2 domain-containing sensor protein